MESYLFLKDCSSSDSDPGTPSMQLLHSFKNATRA